VTQKESVVEFTVATRQEPGHAVLEVAGDVDINTAPILRDRLIDIVNQGEVHLIVDLRDVDFLDSTGLGTLAGALKRVTVRDGSLQVVCANDRMSQLFDITGLARFIPVHRTLADATPG
jgi:anti-sigma B factor antagonist